MAGTGCSERIHLEDRDWGRSARGIHAGVMHVGTSGDELRHECVTGIQLATAELRVDVVMGSAFRLGPAI